LIEKATLFRSNLQNRDQKEKPPKFRDLFKEFWEDDGEIRIGGRAGMVHLPHEGDESEDGDRVSFPRWGKRNVVSYHFTELFLGIAEFWRLSQFD